MSSYPMVFAQIDWLSFKRQLMLGEIFLRERIHIVFLIFTDIYFCIKIVEWEQYVSQTIDKINLEYWNMH